MMKRVITPLLISAIAFIALPCCVSCTEPNQNEEQPEEQKDKPQEPEPFVLEAGTYTFTVSPLKQRWEVGDQIYVHGAYGPSAQIITLKASDISEDGKTASAVLDEVTKLPVKPDGLYAAWPAEAVLESEGVQEPVIEFKSVNSLLTVAYLDGKNFAFVDASAGVAFKAPGFSSYAFSAISRTGLRVTEYKALYQSGIYDFTTRKSDGYPFIYGTITDGADTLWFPGSITLRKGIVINLSKDGETWPSIFSLDEDVKLKVGEIKNLEDLTVSLKDYEGLAPKMPEMVGKPTRFSVAVGDLSGLCLSKDKDFMWTVGNVGTLAKIKFDDVTAYDIRSISGDTEAVTLDPVTGNLYIALEPNGVAMLAPGEDGSYSGKPQTLFRIQEAAKYSNSGMEGITCYKNGLIYCGTQTGANLFLCDPTAPVDEKLYTTVIEMKSLNQLHPSISEVGGLFYDELTDWLWVTDSETRKIYALTGDAEQLLGSYSVKQVGNAESICVDHAHSCIWIGNDPDGNPSSVYRFDFTGLDDAIINHD